MSKLIYFKAIFDLLPEDISVQECDARNGDTCTIPAGPAIPNSAHLFPEHYYRCSNQANNMQDQYQRRTKKAWHVLYTSGNYNVLVVYLFIEKLFPVYHVCCKRYGCIFGIWECSLY